MVTALLPASGRLGHTGAVSRDTLVTHLGAARPLVKISGELDLLSADAAGDHLVHIIANLGPDITVDLSQLRFCDARGLSALLRAANRADRDGGAVELRGVSPQMARLLELTGLRRRFR